MLFNANHIDKVGKTMPSFTNDDIRTAPQFYRAGMDFIMQHRHPIIEAFLETVGEHVMQEPSKWKQMSLDSRVSMLMPRFYPCIPGWHCDDFYRPDGQPDLEHVHEKAPAVHYMVILGDAGSHTKFISQPLELPLLRGPSPVYARYHQIIEALQPETFEVHPGEILRFSPTDFHTGQAATRRGWRIFIRATFSNHREPKNELRAQTQVYVDPKESGW